VPEILSLLVNEVRETGVDVARGDGVDTGEVAPFVSQRLGQMDAASLSNVVRGLRGLATIFVRIESLLTCS
jgi:hypothetical protein